MFMLCCCCFENVKFLLLSSLLSNHGIHIVVLIKILFFKASSVGGYVLQYFCFCPVILGLHVTCVHSERQLVWYGAEV